MSHEPNQMPPEWLAGYVDGELPTPDRAAVERRLAESPELRDLLDDQEALAPTNTDYWRSVASPTPTAAQWQRVQAQLHDHTTPIHTGHLGRWLAAFALVATAASVLLLVTLNRSQPAPTPHTPDIAQQGSPPVEELGFLHMALASDVEIFCLPEEMASLLISGAHPLGRDILMLAQADEIEFHGIGADPDGRFPEDPKNGQAKEPPPPVLWAPNAP